MLQAGIQSVLTFPARRCEDLCAWIKKVEAICKKCQNMSLKTFCNVCGENGFVKYPQSQPGGRGGTHLRHRASENSNFLQHLFNLMKLMDSSLSTMIYE